MPDVFIACDPADASMAARVAAAVKAAGYSVWWDVDGVGGAQAHAQLSKASAVLSLWSRDSTAPTSAARRQASAALAAGKLVSTSIAPCRLPQKLREAATVDLSKWDGQDLASANWRGVLARLAALIGRPPASPPPLPYLEQGPVAAMPIHDQGPPAPPRWLLPASLAGAAAAGAVALIAANVGSLSLLNAAQPGPAEATPPPGATATGQASLATASGPALAVGVDGAPAPFIDSRAAAAQMRAPIVRNPQGLADFAAFRECETCPDMIVLPAGVFQMGSPATEAGRFNDEDDVAGDTGQPVQVETPRFAIARFETTWDDWAACVAAGACDGAAVEAAGATTDGAADAGR